MEAERVSPATPEKPMYAFHLHNRPQASAKPINGRWRVWVYADGGFWLGRVSLTARFTGNGRARSFKTEAAAKKAARAAGFRV